MSLKSVMGVLTMMPSLRENQAAAEKLINNEEDLCFTPATVLAAAIRQKKVSPVEAIDAVYARLYKINPKINAFATPTEIAKIGPNWDDLRTEHQGHQPFT